jgi:hypothetical protein
MSTTFWQQMTLSLNKMYNIKINIITIFIYIKIFFSHTYWRADHEEAIAGVLKPVFLMLSHQSEIKWANNDDEQQRKQLWPR